MLWVEDDTAIAGFFKGDGSLLTNVNADVLDGLDSTAFAAAAHAHNAADISSGALADKMRCAKRFGMRAVGTATRGEPRTHSL